MSNFADRDGGHSIVMMDMRYMWSAIDSPWLIPNRRQPSRLVVFKRSIRWKNGSGEVELSSGWVVRVERTLMMLLVVEINVSVIWYREGSRRSFSLEWTYRLRVSSGRLLGRA
jgi:hypothetical protein